MKNVEEISAEVVDAAFRYLPMIERENLPEQDDLFDSREDAKTRR